MSVSESLSESLSESRSETLRESLSGPLAGSLAPHPAPAAGTTSPFSGETAVLAIGQDALASGLSLEIRIEQALDAMREGRPVVLLDDDDRENEADLILSAERLTQANMAMMIRECSGIVCLCLTREKSASLGLRPMVEDNRSQYGTAFTVSIEARTGVTTGVSAADRITTIRAAIAEDAGDDAVVSPGHVFPLVAVDGGVLVRRGHTEGSVDLARMAGLAPAAVLCELMNPDGTMARRAEALAFAQMYRLPVLTIADLVAWRLSRERA